MTAPTPNAARMTAASGASTVRDGVKRTSAGSPFRNTIHPAPITASAATIARSQRVTIRPTPRPRAYQPCRAGFAGRGTSVARAAA